jgi:membrane fusion protein (multidrug efflux system)
MNPLIKIQEIYKFVKNCTCSFSLKNIIMNPFTTKKFLLAIAVFIIPGILITGCKTKEKEEVKPPLLKVLEIKGNKIPVYLEMVGQAVGIPTVEVTARVEGYLQNWSFKEGSIVRKGQLLFTIEQDKYLNNVKYSEADLASKTAAWEKAKLDVARLKPLLSTKAISQNDYDVAVTNEKQCKAAVESAQANLSDSKLNLAYTTIPSPINGYIGKVNVNPGNLVGHGESTLLTTISAIDPIYFDFQMNETDFLKIRRYLMEIKVEMAELEKSIVAYLKLSDKKDYDAPGKIDFIDRAINPKTGTIAMRAVFNNPDGLIKPGNFANVVLVLTEKENAVVIPQSAIIEIQGKFFAFKVDTQNKVTRVPITPGRNMENKVVINDGLTPGDKILIEGFQKFQEGMVITPQLVQDTSVAVKRPE